MAVKFLNGIDVDGSMNIAASDVPNLDASKITSGTLSADRIPNLSGTYQPAGDYLTLETAETSFQPIGNYLTSVPAEYLTQTEGDARYLQSLPSHNHDGRYLRTGVTLGSFTEVDAIEDDRVVGLTSYTGAPYANHNIVATFINHASGGRRAQLFFGDTPNAGAWFRLRQGTDVQHDWYKLWNSFDFTSTNISNWNTAYGWGNHASAGYLTSLPSHNHDTLYDALGSAAAVNERIDTEVFDAIATVDGNIPTNNNQLTNGAGYITDLPDAGIGAGTYGSTSNQVKIDTITVDAKGRVTAVATGTGGDITTVRLVDDAGSYVQDTGGTAVLTIAGGSGITTSASGTTITVTNDEAGQAGAVNSRIDDEVFPALGDLGNAIPTNNNQLTNGAGYATTSYVDTSVSNLVSSAPAALNTLNELAAALGDDANFSTTVANNIGAIDERINTEVFDAINSKQNAGNYATFSYITLNDSATTASFIAELMTEHAAFQDNYRAYKVGWSYAGNSNLDVGFESVELAGCLIECFGGTYKHIRLTRPTTGTGGRSIYVYNDQGSSYAPGWRQIWTSDEFNSTNVSNWNTAYGWGNHASAGYLTSVPSGYATDSELASVEQSINERIDTEVFDAIPTNNNQLTNGAGYITSADGGNANLLDGLDSSVFMRKSANSILDMNNYNIREVNHIEMNDPGYGEGVRWANFMIYECPDDLSNQAGNFHVASTSDASIRVTVDTNGNLYPSRDRLHLLGTDTNRWQIVFCEILDSAGQHEKNLQNPEGEKSVGDYPTGTVLVWKGGKNVPCTEAADHMRMGIAVEGIASPLIQGAEPVLVTGKVNEGDYLVTSRKEGHAEAVSPEFMRQHGLYDCVLGKALESGEGESYLLKTWINI